MKRAAFLLAVAVTIGVMSGCSRSSPAPTSSKPQPFEISLPEESSASSQELGQDTQGEGMQVIENIDWSVVQRQVDQEILAEMAQKDVYTAGAPLVLLDPYKAAPLTALIIFDELQECSVTVTIPGKKDYTTFTHTFPEMRTHHEIPVYGLYAGQENKVSLRLSYSDGTEKEIIVPITTEKLPEYIAPYQIITSKPEKMGGDGDELLFFGMATDTVHPFAIDKDGEVRWYSSHKEFSGGIFRRMQDGRFLAFPEPLYAPAFIRPGIVIMDRMGKVYDQYLVDLVHHDAIEMPNGDLLIASMLPGSEIPMNGMTLGLDVIIQMDVKTGEVVNEWDLNQICGYRTENVDESVYNAPENQFSGQFLHINSLWYNEKDNSIMVSSPTMKVVVKFDAATKEIKWAIGDPRNGYPEQIQSKILKPVGEGFEWNGAQHAAMVLPNGYIMMDDNGSGRLDAQGEAVLDADNYSRLVIFDVNEADMTIRQVYQYGKERGNELFATYLGDADYLGENHYLLNAGGRIVDENGVAQGSAFDVYMGIRRAEAKIVELLDGEPVLEVHIGTDDLSSFHNIYRVEWDSVYAKEEKEYDLQVFSPNVFGSLSASASVKFVMPEQAEPFEVTCAPKNYGYQLNVPVIVEDMTPEYELLMELKGASEVKYFSAAGMGGAQGIVRAQGLKPDVYAINFVLQNKDGSVKYAQTGYAWDLTK